MTHGRANKPPVIRKNKIAYGPSQQHVGRRPRLAMDLKFFVDAKITVSKLSLPVFIALDKLMKSPYPYGRTCVPWRQPL
jgi:hypothetical protein